MVQVSILTQFQDLHLSLVGGASGLDRAVTSAELNRPGLEISGCFEFFDPLRIQILGRGEISFLNLHAGEPETKTTLEKLFDPAVPCVIITNSLEPPRLLLETAEELGVPVFSTDIGTTRLYRRLYESLESFFSPHTLIHGTLVDVLGMGVLLLGESGVGKSECALELVQRGHSLVADDVVRVTCLGEQRLQGESPHLLRHFLEVRGLGIVDLSKLYGVRAIRKRKQVDLIITLEEWKRDTHVERVGVDTRFYSILGVERPHLCIPVKPGRNLSTIIEVGARDHRLRLMGVHSAKEFDARVRNMTGGKKDPESEQPSWI